MLKQNNAEMVHVALAERAYDIEIGAGLLAQAGEKIKAALGCKRALIVTDAHVALHYLPQLKASLTASNIAYETVILPAGEGTKSFPQLEALMPQLLAFKPDRQTPLLALGGGVIGDITGFAASILLRGVPFVQIPTTLLAMVDSSVGGKTGINTAYGKNLVGSFYQPSLVLMDTDVLQTLPLRELRAGYAEVVKYGCINQPEFFAKLAAQQGISPEFLPYAIAVSCRVKAEIVVEDERETGESRALLNFGHTFGHALEAECGYNGTLLHGEGVAIGMVMAATLSEQLGLCESGVAGHIKAVLQQAGLPIHPHDIRKDWDIEALLNRMRQDKKVKEGQMRLILLREIGEAFLTTQATEADVRRCWEAFL